MLLEFIVTPLLSALRAVVEFVFWLACWCVWQLFGGVAWAARSLKALLRLS